MKVRILLCLSLFALSFAAQPQAVRGAPGSWEPAGPGIEFQLFRIPGPINAFVARMERGNPIVTLESSLAQGKIAGGTDTVSHMADHYDQALSSWDYSWGTRNRVVVAINGSYFDPPGIPRRGQIQSGWYVKRFDNNQSGSGFVWKMDRSAFIGECVKHAGDEQHIAYFRTGEVQAINGVNLLRKPNQLVLYTPQYDRSTNTDSSGVEVLVEVKRPTQLAESNHTVNGRVIEVRDGQGSTPIPFDNVVLSAHGHARDVLLQNILPGDVIGIAQKIHSYSEDCRTALPLDWSGAYASIGGSFYYLKEGEIRLFPTNVGAITPHPRTAIAYNQDYVFFIVVDGRDKDTSVGMTIQQLGIFTRDHLGATHGIAQDGGGSSTLVVNGVVMNKPNGGRSCRTELECEREIANGMMMVVVERMEKSTKFSPGDAVKTVSPTDLYLGPGTNYFILTPLAANIEGMVVSHANQLDGVLAKGSHWWKVAFGDLSGWVQEERLAPGGDLRRFNLFSWQ